MPSTDWSRRRWADERQIISARVPCLGSLRARRGGERTAAIVNGAAEGFRGVRSPPAAQTLQCKEAWERGSPPPLARARPLETYVQHKIYALRAGGSNTSLRSKASLTGKFYSPSRRRSATLAPTIWTASCFTPPTPTTGYAEDVACHWKAFMTRRRPSIGPQQLLRLPRLESLCRNARIKPAAIQTALAQKRVTTRISGPSCRESGIIFELLELLTANPEVLAAPDGSSSPPNTGEAQPKCFSAI